MEKVFSDKTEEGIRLIWMQFDPEKTAEGVRLLREAADAGDPDALCFLARTYMGERYVWEYAALEINGEKAASLLKEGIRRGSVDCEFSPGLVDGDYAKSKAAATELVFDAAERGLNASIVLPSGIIGPGDLQGGSFTSMAKSFLAGKLPLAVRGGYDFVDVRDVANGLLACSEIGELGKGYILSGHYVTIRKMLQLVGKTAKLKYRPICLPLGLAKLAAPYYERRSLKDRKPLFYTPYSVSVLASNGRFSHAAASERFAYQPRPMEETLRDMTAWLLEQRRKD